MTHDQLVDYLGATSLRCRFLAETASDMEAAEELRRVADEMEMARSALSETPVSSEALADASSTAKSMPRLCDGISIIDVVI